METGGESQPAERKKQKGVAGHRAPRTYSAGCALFHFAFSLASSCCLRSLACSLQEGARLAAIASSAAECRSTFASLILRVCAATLARFEGTMSGSHALTSSSERAVCLTVGLGVGRSGGTQAGEGRNLGRSEESLICRVTMFPFVSVTSVGQLLAAWVTRPN